MAKKSIRPGTLWKDEIRKALRSSRIVLLILTAKSVSSSWLMCEAGAFWVLDKPMVAALWQVDVKALPEVISAFQCKNVDTTDDLDTLIDDIANLCGE